MAVHRLRLKKKLANATPFDHVFDPYLRESEEARFLCISVSAATLRENSRTRIVPDSDSDEGALEDGDDEHSGPPQLSVGQLRVPSSWAARRYRQQTN